MRAQEGLHLDDKLWVGVGEALELVLVQVHDEELVGWRQLDGHLCELPVEVGGVASIFLVGHEREQVEGERGRDKKVF